MTKVWLALLGVPFLLIGVYDVLKTTLQPSRDGPLTHYLVAFTKYLAVSLHKRFGYRHRSLMNILGPLSSILTVLNWIILFFFGSMLIFVSQANSVTNINNENGSILDKVYFVMYTFSTLGIGDYSPTPGFFKIYTSLFSLWGFSFVSLTVSYILSVQAAYVSAKQAASFIWSLGSSPVPILARSWNGKDFGKLNDYLFTLSEMISSQAQSHKAFPVMFNFYERDLSEAIPLRAAALGELICLLECALHYSHADDIDIMTLRACSRALHHYLETNRKLNIWCYKATSDEVPPVLSLDSLRKDGLPLVSDEIYLERIHSPLVERKRRELRKFVESNGWRWEDVFSDPFL